MPTQFISVKSGYFALMSANSHKSILPNPFDPQKVLLFRMVHIGVLAELFKKGEICPPNHQDIRTYGQHQLAKPNMLDKRKSRIVPLVAGTTLHDYVAFYFAPRSPMLYSIYKGNEDGVQCSQRDIVYLITQVEKIEQQGLEYVFSNANALLRYTAFENELSKVATHVDFPLMDAVYWNDLPDDRQRKERRMAEFLVRGCLPLEAIIGIATYDDGTAKRVREIAPEYRADRIVCRPHFYF